jgi:hypothetical protein
MKHKSSPQKKYLKFDDFKYGDNRETKHTPTTYAYPMHYVGTGVIINIWLMT